MTEIRNYQQSTYNRHLPRMRTVHEATVELRKLDAGTAVTEYHIRQLAINNIIPRVKAGKKYLINLDALIAYLADPQTLDCDGGKAI